MPVRQSRSQPVRAVLARVWPTDRISLALLFVATGNFVVLSALLVYPDPLLDYPLMIGDAQDWVANGLYYLGHPVVYSARPPLFPLVVAALESLSVLPLTPVLVQGLVLLTGLGLYRTLSQRCDKLVAALATIAWLTNGTWVWWGATWHADVPAACLLGWMLILWQRRDADGRPGYALAGLAGGLSAITQPIAVLMVIPVLATVIWHRRADLARRAFILGALLFVTPGIVWVAVRMRLVGTLGDVIYRNWAAVGLHTGSVNDAGSFYAWSLVAVFGIPALAPIAIGLWIMVRRVNRSDWACLVVGGFATIMVFFLAVYDSNSARFLAYVYPFVLVFVVEGLSRIRIRAAAVSLAVLMIAWGLPLREEVMKWHRIVLSPLPIVDLKMSARNIDGIWTLVPGIERPAVQEAINRYVPVYFKRIRGIPRPRRVERESLAADQRVVYFTEESDHHHRLYHQTRLGNQLRKKVYHVPFGVVAGSWPPVAMEFVGFHDDVVLFRARLPGEARSHVVALTPGGKAQNLLAGPPQPEPPVRQALAVARRVSPLLEDERLLVLCGPEGAEPWQASLPFVADVRDLWFTGPWGFEMIRSVLGPEQDRQEVDGVVVSTRLIHEMPWSVIGADLIDPSREGAGQPPK